MPSSSPLTASERKLSFVLLGAIALVIAMPILAFGIREVRSNCRYLALSIQQEWSTVLGGAWPEISIDSFMALVLISIAIGPLLLFPLHLGAMNGWKRSLPPSALWFWTMLYGLLPAICGVMYAWVLVTFEHWSPKEIPRWTLFSAGEFLLGLLISIPAFRAWRARQREAMGALPAAG